MSGDAIDFYLRDDLSAAGKQLVEDLGMEWKSAIFPTEGTDDALEPYIVESALADDRGAALAVAKSLDSFYGRSQTWYQLALTTELQALEPWLIKLALTDSDNEDLLTPRDSYLVRVLDGDFQSTVFVLIIEDDPV